MTIEIGPDGWPVLTIGQSLAVIDPVPPPTPEELASFLRWPPFDEEQEAAAQAHIDRAMLLVKSYTRGRGFHADGLAKPLREVVLSLAGRSLSNPTSAQRIAAGNYVETPGQPDFALAERLIMDHFRRRIA